MSDAVEELILDLLDWIGSEPRPYADVIDAWRTSCPRLPVWEEANEHGYVAYQYTKGRGVRVLVTPLGNEFLELERSSERRLAPIIPIS